MYDIEQKLRASKEACDTYIDKMGDTQQELRKQGRIEEYYDVAGELLVIYAERLLQAIPVKDHTRFIEIAALQDLLAQLSVGYPDAAAQAQELRENLGALRMLRVAERHVKDEMRWQQREIRRLERAGVRLEEILAEEREKNEPDQGLHGSCRDPGRRVRKAEQGTQIVPTQAVGGRSGEAGRAETEERGRGFGVPGGHALRRGRIRRTRTMTVRVEIVAEISGVGIAAAGEFYTAVQEAVMDVLREVGARPVRMKMREVRPDGDRK